MQRATAWNRNTFLKFRNNYQIMGIFLQTYDYKFLGVGTCTLVLLCVLFFYNPSRETASSTSRKVGLSLDGAGEVERKFDKQVVWDGLRKGAPLFNGDTVRTGPDSRAILKVGSRLFVDMEANAMVLISIKDKKPVFIILKGALRFWRGVKGNIDLGNDKEDTQKDYRIISGKRVVSVSSGAVALRLGSGENELTVQVSQGQVILSSGKESRAVGTGFLARFPPSEKGQAPGPIQLEEPSLKLTAPEDNSIIFMQPGHPQPQEFRWSPAEPVVFELSTEPGFVRPIHRRQIKEGGLKLPINKGVYFWRVLSLQTGSASLVRKLTVIEQHPLVLLSPYGKTNGRYNFTWRPLPFTHSYRLSLAQDREFTRPIQVMETNSVNLSFHPPAREFYWKVAARSDFPGGDVESPPWHSSKPFPEHSMPEKPEAGGVQKPSAITAAAIALFPRLEGVVDMSKRDTLPLRWRPVPGARLYLVELHNLEKRKRVLSIRTDNAGHVVQDLSILDVGRFLLTIEANPGTGEANKFSIPFRIQLQEDEGGLKIKIPKR